MKKFASKALRKVIAALWRMSNWMGGLGNRLNDKQFRYFDFVSQPDDIFVVTYPRSGTTLMQQLLYQLKTDGAMDFAHISEVVPFFDRLSVNRYRRLKTLPQPRLFKSHYAYASMPRGPGKYIYVARDGMDVAVSYYHFYRSHIGVNWSFAEFFSRFMCGRVQYGLWFEHVAGWWRHRDDPNVLFLRYEDLVAHMPQTLEQIAAFCGVALTPDHRQRILERCSFTFMKENESKFDHLTEMLWERGMTQGRFIRKGKFGEERELFSDVQQTAYDVELAKWPLPERVVPYSNRNATALTIA